MANEPGQLAFETMYQVRGDKESLWGVTVQSERDEWAAVESAVRADERRKVLEEACKAVDTRGPFSAGPLYSAGWSAAVDESIARIRAMMDAADAKGEASDGK